MTKPALIKSPIHELHQKLGAKFIPFAGHEMPLQYHTGIIQEHLHCRNKVGFFDISHMGQCLIKGQNAAQELEKLTPSDISRLHTGQLQYAVLTNANGGVIDDIIITRTNSGYQLIVNAACKEKDFTHLKQQLSSPCSLTILPEQSLFALQGPMANQLMSKLSKAATQLHFMQSCACHIGEMPCRISRCGYTGEDGFEISIHQQYAQQLAERILAFPSVQAIGLGARDTLRLEAGLALYGHELNESINPVEAGLKWTFRKQAHGFLGANSLLPLIKTGASRKRIGLQIEGKIPVRQDTELYNKKDQKIGIVTSGNYSPCLEKPIALALIDETNTDTTLFAAVRNRAIPVHPSTLPFIAHRYRRP